MYKMQVLQPHFFFTVARKWYGNLWAFYKSTYFLQDEAEESCVSVILTMRSYLSLGFTLYWKHF